MRTVTHIAGAPITLGGNYPRVIQRCSLCGEKLVDSKGMMAPVGPDGTAPSVGTWEVGRLIQVEGGNPTRFSLLPDSEQLPDDSCLALVEE